MRTCPNDCSVFDDVETIAGTSVGSLTACLFSVGPTCDELKDFVGDKNLLEILEIDKAVIPFFLSLDPLEKFINHYFKINILNFLDQVPGPLTEEIAILFNHLKNDDYAITFQDLFNLNKQWPKKFKNLITHLTHGNINKPWILIPSSRFD